MFCYWLPLPRGEGWSEGPVDHRRTIAEIESEETDAFSRRKVLGIARSQMRKNAHRAIQLAEAPGEALPSPNAVKYFRT